MFVYENELMHFGVKGMRWGVRKKNVTSGDVSERKAQKAKAKADRAQAEAEKKQFKQDVKLARKGQYRDRYDLHFTGDTTRNKDGTLHIENIRYFSGKKRIGQKKFNELSSYTRKVYSQAEKDAERGRKITNAIMYGAAGLMAIGATALGRLDT